MERKYVIFLIIALYVSPYLVKFMIVFLKFLFRSNAMFSIFDSFAGNDVLRDQSGSKEVQKIEPSEDARKLRDPDDKPDPQAQPDPEPEDRKRMPNTLCPFSFTQ